MHWTHTTFNSSILMASVALALGTFPARAIGDGALAPAPSFFDEATGGGETADSSPASADRVDERMVLEALRQEWSRKPAMSWLAQAPEAEQEAWTSLVVSLGAAYRNVRTIMEDPERLVRDRLQETMRANGIDGDAEDYVLSVGQDIDVGGALVSATHEFPLPEACLGYEIGLDFERGTVFRDGASVPADQSRTLVGLLTQPWCRVSVAERLDRFTAQRAALDTAYAALHETRLRKSLLEARLKGHLTGGRDAWIKGLDIVRSAMDGAADVETGVLAFSTGTDQVSVTLPQWLVFVKRDAQGHEDGVVLYRPDEQGLPSSGDRQDFFQYLDMRRLGQAVAGRETCREGTSSLLMETILEAAGQAERTPVVKFLDDLCMKPTLWRDNLRFVPYPGRSFQENMAAWAHGKTGLAAQDLERSASTPNLPSLIARHHAVAQQFKAFHERHAPPFRQFAWRREGEKLTKFFREEKFIPDTGEIDPDTILIEFNGKNMPWTDWVLEGYRRHGDNVLAETNNFVRDARLSSRDLRIQPRLNMQDFKESVERNLRSTYAGDEYVQALRAMLDPRDPRFQRGRDLRVAMQVLGMQLALEVEHSQGNVSRDDYRWLKGVLDALPGGLDRDDVEIAQFALSGMRIPGMWVVSRTWPAGRDRARPLRESFVFVPEGPYGRALYKYDAYFGSLLRTVRFKDYLAGKALAKDRARVKTALAGANTPLFHTSLNPVRDFKDECDQWLKDAISDAEEATTSKAEVISTQVLKGIRYATTAVCVASSGGTGALPCALGSGVLMGADSYHALDKLGRGETDDALWDVALLWMDVSDVSRGLKVVNPTKLLRLVGKRHFANVDEATDAIAAARRQGKFFRPDGTLNNESARVEVERLTPMQGRPGRAIEGRFYNHDGKTYIAEHGRAFEVYSDNAWSTIRLRDSSRPHAQGAPIVYRHGHWQLDEGGLRGGGKAQSKPSKASEPALVGMRRSVDSPEPAAQPAARSSTFEYEVPEEHKEILYKAMRDGARKLDSRYGPIGPAANADEQRIKANFYALRERLLAKATSELAVPPARPRPTMPAMRSNMTQDDMVSEFYRATDGLVLGESHSSVASKRFLIDNMALLKREGVETIYLEHLLRDFHQADLDAYFRSPAGAPMPPRLKAYLDTLDRGHHTDPSGMYTFLKVVESAKEHQVRPIAIDVLASYMQKGMNAREPRIPAMNYLAWRIIEDDQARYPHRKWIALVGNAHANTLEGTPGVAELTGSIGVRVQDLRHDGTLDIRPDPGISARLGISGPEPKVTVRSDFLLGVPAVPLPTRS